MSLSVSIGRQGQICIRGSYGSDHKNPDLSRVLYFFYSLPLWLELDGLRIIHACWHAESIEYLASLLNQNHTLSKELLVAGIPPGSPEYDAIAVPYTTLRAHATH